MTRYDKHKWVVIAVGLAVAAMGEPLAGAMLLLGAEVGIALGRERAREISEGERLARDPD